MKLPVKYQWLDKEEGPKMIKEALKFYGTLEAKGSQNNGVILAWARSLGIDYYKEDSVPWCGLFMAIVAKNAGKDVVNDPLRALSWAKFGNLTNTPMLGDVLTFKRDGGGHVGLYIGEDDKAYHVLGGNQSDSVSITRILKSRLYEARRPIFKTGQPANVRKIFLDNTGKISTNEK